MKILILTKGGRLEETILKFVRESFSSCKLYLLNIVETSGEIPTKFNGEVIDNCTEFNLNDYEREQRINTSELNNYLNYEEVVSAKSIVGNLESILQNQIISNSIDLVISGSHLTSGMSEDFIWSTVAGRILHNANIPYLCFKTSNKVERIDSIAIVRDFKEPKRENLKALMVLQKYFASRIIFFKINTPEDHQNHEAILANMLEFVRINKIGGHEISYEVFQSSDKEKGVKEIIDKHKINLLALGRIERKGTMSLLRGDLKTDIINHITSPVFIY